MADDMEEVLPCEVLAAAFEGAIKLLHERRIEFNPVDLLRGFPD